MSKIKILPQNVVQKIAAGEVVDRPASIVKELIENAIDAGSFSIKVVLEKGGIGKIQVIDNGSGINKEDLEVIFARHATSKISSEDDLLQITSLGFRGEALYSIAAVSQVKIETRVKGSEKGLSLEIKEGMKEKVKTVGCPVGTNIMVSDLFFNVPARQKFLKSESTELKYCREIFMAQALAHPEIRFELWHNQSKLLQLPSQKLKERINSLYEIEENDLLAVTFDHQYLKISGFVGKPGIARTRRIKQQLIVNQRPVENKLVYSAVKQSFGSYLPEGSYPLFFLNFQIRPDLIDVNMHPRKEEVKFAVSDLVFRSVQQAITAVLKNQDLIPAGKVYLKKESSVWQFPDQGKTVTNFHSQGKITPRQSQAALHFNASLMMEKKQLPENDAAPIFPPKEENKVFPWEEMKENKDSIFQVALTYLVEIKNEELVLYDQHALHERVLLEKFINQYLEKQQKGEQQNLLFPEEIKLNFEEQEIVKKEKETLEKVGFELEIKEKELLIKAIPTVLKPEELRARFLDFVDSLISNEEIEIKDSYQIDSRTRRTLTFLACRCAIKAGDYLTENERQNLLVQFRKTEERYTCPHGRPVVVKIGRKELEKMFMR